MKKEKILIMVPLMLLASCDVTNSSNIIDVKIFEEKVEKVAKENLKFDGTLTYKFYDEGGYQLQESLLFLSLMLNLLIMVI